MLVEGKVEIGEVAGGVAEGSSCRFFYCTPLIFLSIVLDVTQKHIQLVRLKLHMCHDYIIKWSWC